MPLLSGRTARRTARTRRPRLPHTLRLPQRLRKPRPALTTGAGALLALPLLAVAPAFRAFFDLTAGVLTLVSLTSAVVWGLLSTGRTVLAPHTRLLAQGVHRALATASLGFLVLHIAVKVAEAHARFLDAFLPFTSVVLPGPVAPGTAPLIGFGTLAGLLMVLAAATGALRSSFAGRGRTSGRWRALHTSAYAAWCLALVHGLKSGRAPAGWVTTGYVLCLAAVMGALVTRLLFTPCAEFPYLTWRRELPFSWPPRSRKAGRRRTGHRAVRRTGTHSAAFEAQPAAQEAAPTDTSVGETQEVPSWALADAPTERLPYVSAPYAPHDDSLPDSDFAPGEVHAERLPYAGLGTAPYAPEWAGPPTLVQPVVPGVHPENAAHPYAPNGRTS
ncbi:hypothetical protein [Streptomyces olivaceiscleroticus]|uniref:hypothetical protein n=1 Tax=Streptomyces olivaceiscleroticus TaxID=68245 RepID=UPI0031FA2A03